MLWHVKMSAMKTDCTLGWCVGVGEQDFKYILRFKSALVIANPWYNCRLNLKNVKVATRINVYFHQHIHGLQKRMLPTCGQWIRWMNCHEILNRHSCSEESTDVGYPLTFHECHHVNTITGFRQNVWRTVGCSILCSDKESQVNTIVCLHFQYLLFNFKISALNMINFDARYGHGSWPVQEEWHWIKLRNDVIYILTI